MSLEALHDAIVGCVRCPRLVEWRGQVGEEKRAAYRDEEYWARPVPGFGDPDAGLLVVGLAPGAHGANRTGRAFTGDGAGQVLYRALHRAGLASTPVAASRDDGLFLRGAWVTNAVKCVPPANAPKAAERDACLPYLEAELGLLPVRALLALGVAAWGVALRAVGASPTKRPFGHAAEARVGELTLVASYHPSRQNTNTGRLTPSMLDAVVTRAAALAGDR